MDKFLGFVKRHKILVAVLIGVVVLVGWWNYQFPSATWRYKMTVTVETPEGIKTGSAVREVSISYGPTIGDIPSTNVTVKGEAVVVDLGERGKLFALLGNQFAYDLIFRAFPYDKGGLTKEGIEYYRHLKNGKASLLKINYLPSFVTFKNLNDPLTVKGADPVIIEKTLGKGVRIKDVTVEMTDEPVTWAIDSYLPWIDALNGGYLDGGFTSMHAPLGLDAGQFKRGE